jgi:hypothetical protein
MWFEREVARARDAERLRRAAEHRLTARTRAERAAAQNEPARPRVRDVVGYGLVRAGIRILDAGRSSA